MRQFARWIPAAAIVVVAGAVGVWQLGRDDTSKPLAIASSAATFDSLDELITASDLVVVATITDIADGRTITSPADPDAGIHTRLVELDVTDTLHGEAPDRLVVEEADAFADGSPIVLDRMTKLDVGDRAVWFLVAGGSDAMPYFAAVNSQARFQVVGDALDPSGDDALSRDIAELGLEGLAARIAAP